MFCLSYIDLWQSVSPVINILTSLHVGERYINVQLGQNYAYVNIVQLSCEFPTQHFIGNSQMYVHTLKHVCTCDLLQQRPSEALGHTLAKIRRSCDVHFLRGRRFVLRLCIVMQCGSLAQHDGFNQVQLHTIKLCVAAVCLLPGLLPTTKYIHPVCTFCLRIILCCMVVPGCTSCTSHHVF